MTKIEVKYIWPTRWLRPWPLLLSVGYSGVIKPLFVIASCVCVRMCVCGGGGYLFNPGVVVYFILSFLV